MRIRPAVAALIAVLLGCAVLGVVGINVAGRTRPALAADLRHRQRPGGRPAQGALRRLDPVRGAADRAAGADRRAGALAGAGAAPQPRGLGDLALGSGHRRCAAARPAQGADHRRLPPPAGDGDAGDGPRTRRDPRTERPPAAAGDAVRLRDRLPCPAGGDGQRDRARRAPRRAAAPDRPPARLPLCRRRRDTARLRRPHRRRRPGGPRPPQLGDDDRRDLARRLHDDGPGARGRLLAPDRLPLPRGARGRARPARGREAQPGDRRPDDGLRRRDPAGGAGAIGVRPTRLAAALAGGHGRGGDRPQRRRRGRGAARAADPARRPRQRRRDRRLTRLPLPGRGDGGGSAPPPRPRRGADRGAAASARRPGDRPGHGGARNRRAAELEPGAQERGSDRRRGRARVGSAVRPARGRAGRPDHDPREARPAQQVAAPDRLPARDPGGGRAGIGRRGHQAAARTGGDLHQHRARAGPATSPDSGPGCGARRTPSPNCAAASPRAPPAAPC